MLLSIRPGLVRSRVFEGLNQFLRELILATLEGRIVAPNGMPAGLHAAVEGNKATKDLVTAMQEALTILEQTQKDALRSELLLDRAPCSYLIDRALSLPDIPDSVFPHLKRLSVHLYERTAKLAGVEAACGERIDDHFARFRADGAPGNGNVCCVCGTEYLAQIRAGVDDNEQWRGPYDHLLAKDAYPLFGVHPENLLPICHTCNSKAKLAKDLLYKDGIRRLSFSPWTECATEAEVSVTVCAGDVFPQVLVELHGAGDRQEKLGTWDEVFRIKDRVEGEFRALHIKIAEDVSAESEAEFTANLEQRAQSRAIASRVSPFNYWRARVYRSVKAMDHASREALRLAIQGAIPSEQDIKDVFGV